MRLETAHRRLIVTMALSGLLAFAAGAGLEPISAVLAAGVLISALFWSPSPEAMDRIERAMVPLALIMVIRAILAGTVFDSDIVIPVVDLLLLLLCVEALRSSDTSNDVRLYALTFALVLASTAYRPGILFAISFLLFVVLGSAALAIGLLRRKSVRFSAPEATLDRSFVWTSLGLSVVTFAMSVAVFVTFPRVSRGWSGRGEVLASSIVGFSERISLGQHGSTLRSNPEVVLRVEFPEGRPDDVAGLRWRGRSYDRFDGVEWTRPAAARPARAPVTWYRQRWPDSTVVQKIFAAPLDVPVVFGLHPLLSVDAQSAINPMMDDVGDWFFRGSDQRPTYTGRSAAVAPNADVLRSATGSFYPDRTRYLQLPDLPDRVAALADSLTTPWPNRYDKVVAVHRYLTEEFDYSRELPRTARQTSLDYFLFERRAGHCEYFSSAMVVLLRSAGIHARNVNGFLGGSWNEFGDFLSVTQNEAHSWVEVWFPGIGWVEWDPTPPGSGDGALTARFSFPGQAWIEGMSHRWNQWVLEYNLSAQIDLFDQFGSMLRQRGGESDSGDGMPGGVWWWLGGGVLIVAFGRRTYSRRPDALSPESRAWLSLVRTARRAGLLESDFATPGELLGRVAAERPDALPPVRRLADSYQLMRFGGGDGDGDELRRLRQILGEAKRAIS